MNMRRRKKEERRSKKTKARAYGAIFFLLSSLSLLPSCGFEPVYGVNRNTPVGAETRMADIYVADIPNRNGQYLRNELIDRFNRGGYAENPLWELSIGDLAEEVSGLDVTKASDSTRGQARFDARLLLKNRRTGETVLDRKLRAVVSFNIVGSEFANRVTEQSARENALNDLARQAEAQIALYFKRRQP